MCVKRTGKEDKCGQKSKYESLYMRALGSTNGTVIISRLEDKSYVSDNRTVVQHTLCSPAAL